MIVKVPEVTHSEHMYHVAPISNLNSIMKQGLLPAKITGIKTSSDNGTEDFVYLFDNFSVASLYRKFIEDALSIKAVILKVNTDGLKLEEDPSSCGFRYKGIIRPTRIQK